MPKSPRIGDFPGGLRKMSMVNAQQLVTATLLILGAGFLVANARLVLDYLAATARGGRRRCSCGAAGSRPTSGSGSGWRSCWGS